MFSVLVFYATTDGHTRRIAETIASTLRKRGLHSEAHELSSRSPSPDWPTIRSAVVGASVHAGRHQKSAANFIAREARHLNARPAAFFSVSLSAASTNPAKVEVIRGLATKFVRDAGWQPERLACFAGKLAYTQYGFIKRFIMRRISAPEGGPTDTSRDHEFTDWTAVRDFAHKVADAATADQVSRAAS
jgi:menaquinone-dependent protoporphyrinogen oxidase